jgi:sortase (surface protein transpeptidase)
MVTLTTCHPKGSAAQRLVVQATWVQDIKAA